MDARFIRAALGTGCRSDRDVADALLSRPPAGHVEDRPEIASHPRWSLVRTLGRRPSAVARRPTAPVGVSPHA